MPDLTPGLTEIHASVLHFACTQWRPHPLRVIVSESSPPDLQVSAQSLRTMLWRERQDAQRAP